MKTKILVIEDEIDILENIKLILESESYDVKTVTDGNKGIKYVQIYNPDLIICDIAMPEISGYEVLTKLTADKNFSIPFIFLTAKIDRKDLRKGMELGADDYIFKPFTANELITAINIRLAKHKKIIATVALQNNNISESILIKKNNKVFPIKLSDILYIKAENQYSQLFSKSQKNYLVRKSLTDWLSILPNIHFIRINRSVIINNKYVENVKILNNGLYKLCIKNIAEDFRVSRKHLKNYKSNFTAL